MTIVKMGGEEAQDRAIEAGDSTKVLLTIDLQSGERKARAGRADRRTPHDRRAEGVELRPVIGRGASGEEEQAEGAGERAHRSGDAMVD